MSCIRKEYLSLLIFLFASTASGSPIKKWNILGPFVVGKNELDGEPWLTSNSTELLSDSATTHRFTADPSGFVKVSWQVDWQSLVSGVGGHELLEWQALAVGSFKLGKSKEVLISCKGVPSFSLDGTLPWVGDLYQAGFPASFVKLEAGTHHLKIRLRGKVQSQFACHVDQTDATSPLEVVPGETFAAAPDLVEFGDMTRLAGHFVALPVVSRVAQHRRDNGWIHSLRPVLLSQSQKRSSISIALAEPPVDLSLAPGQAIRLPVRLTLVGSGNCGVDEHVLELAVQGEFEGRQIQTSTIKIALKCRKPTQSLVFTFQDRDGSVQHAGLVLPQPFSGKQPCLKQPCPVMISLSGTSIRARDSADSYKVKTHEDTDYRFGVNGYWLLAPTRHGAHNWEGPGQMTALAALDSLPELAKLLYATEPDINRVLVGGHSMGGHGAWLLATALRDKVIGLASSASWLRKDQYADSNKVLLHDIAAASVDPALAFVLQLAESEFQAEQLAPTLCDGLSILIRVGSQDKTVHPWFSRRMFRTLLSAGANPEDVTLTHVQGKEHWWWDSTVPNDGGAVNDMQMRSFYQGCRSRATGAASLPSKWQFVVLNPATSGSKGGLRILHQFQPHRRSEVTVERKMETQGVSSVHVKTSNVRRFQWDLRELHSLACGGPCSSLTIWLDGQKKLVDNTEVARALAWCRKVERNLGHKSDEWVICADQKTPPLERGLLQLGPMRQLFAQRVCGVVHSDADMTALLYLSNMLFMTGHGHLRMLKVEEVVNRGVLLPPDVCTNLLVVGVAKSNAAVAALLEGSERYSSPLTSGGGGSLGPWVGLGGCRWYGPNIAALALLPWWTSDGDARLALVATGGSVQAATDAVVMLATPTIPPMARQPLTHLLPDYVVMDVKETRSHGAGGFQAAGFWDHQWQYSPGSAWERACNQAAPEIPESDSQLRTEL